MWKQLSAHKEQNLGKVEAVTVDKKLHHIWITT